MHKNPKLLIILGCFSIFLIFGLLWMNAKQPKSAAGENADAQGQKLFDVASGDTNNEVLRTILANQKQLRTQNKKLQQENSKLRQNNADYLKNIVTKTENAFTEKLKQTKESLQQEVLNQKQDVNKLKNKNPDTDDYQIENNTNTKSPHQTEVKNQIIGDVQDLSQTLGENDNKKRLAINDSSLGPTLPSDLEQQSDLKSTVKSNKSNPAVVHSSIPMYTIPANSTLNNVALMSAIIAEVSVSGRLVTPAFPFKAIVGRKDMFAANGMSLPDNLAGMVLEGYSVGNMTMSCARAYVTRALFVFNDGHFIVYPKKDSNQGATSLYPREALGYLTDPYGNTCITGKYITDAPKVLTNIIALSTAGGIGNAIAQAQTSTMSNAFQTNTVISGSMGKYAAGMAIGNTSKEVLNWYLNRVSDVFDAVFIPASIRHRPIKLVFNVTRTIPIDLNKDGRTLRYENSNKLSAVATEFD